MGNKCFCDLSGIGGLWLPRLKVLKAKSINFCKGLEKVYLNSVYELGWDSLSNNRDLKKVGLYQVEKVKTGSLSNNDALKILYCPFLSMIENHAICFNKMLEKGYFNQLSTIKEGALSHNKSNDFYVEAPHLIEGAPSAMKGVTHIYAPLFDVTKLNAPQSRIENLNKLKNKKQIDPVVSKFNCLLKMRYR